MRPLHQPRPVVPSAALARDISDLAVQASAQLIPLVTTPELHSASTARPPARREHASRVRAVDDLSELGVTMELRIARIDALLDTFPPTGALHLALQNYVWKARSLQRLLSELSFATSELAPLNAESLVDYTRWASLWAIGQLEATEPRFRSLREAERVGVTAAPLA